MDDRAALRLARAQHGLIGYRQAPELGLTRRAIQRRVEAGRWERPHESAFRVAGAPPSLEPRLLAGYLAVGGLAAVSHRSAVSHRGPLEPDVPFAELTVGRRRARRPAGLVEHGIAGPSARHGVPCTDPLRTLVGLGAVSPLGAVARALDRALGRRLVTVAGVRVALDAVARKRRRGAGVIRRLLDERTDLPRPAGALEARMAAHLRRHGGPMLVAEHVVRDGERFVGRVDFADPGVRLAVEVDGFDPHGGYEVFRSDRARQNELAAAGWTVLRYTWADVDAMSPGVASGICRTRARAGRGGPRGLRRRTSGAARRWRASGP